jgi:hypothetical protein
VAERDRNRWNNFQGSSRNALDLLRSQELSPKTARAEPETGMPGLDSDPDFEYFRGKTVCLSHVCCSSFRGRTW